MNIHISDAILDRRLELGMSQTEFGELVGSTQRQVSEWENGNASPSPLKRHALVHKGGIDARFMRADEVKAA